MFKIQEYLRSGKTLKDLEIEFGVKANPYRDAIYPLVILNYSQTESPKNHPIVNECRGIVLELDTWNVIAYPFRRFYNKGEVLQETEDFDYKNSYALQKIDGSMINVFWYRDRWFFATRQVIENNSKMPFSELTFKELFYKTSEQYKNFWKFISKNFTYVFELTSPDNKVITPYKERSLTLLTVRHAGTYIECSKNFVWYIARSILDVKYPESFKINSENNLFERIKLLQQLEEGYVAVDYNHYEVDGLSFRRIKIKNPTYVSIAHLKDSGSRSLRALVGLVHSGEQDEFKGYFPEFGEKISLIERKYKDFCSKIQNECIAANFDLDKKSFAAGAKDWTLPSLMFLIYEGKIKMLQDYFKMMEIQKGRKYLEKYIMNALKLNDEEYVDVSNT